MGRRHSDRRQVHGIVLLDKPTGLSSNAALQIVKRLFNARKAGHTGSLDPLASGLLPICLGEATKVSGFLLDADKRYEVVCRLGIRTATGDAEGEVLETLPVGALDQARIDAALARFKGPIEQVPPMYSALKHQGQRLYKLARQGIEVERKPRSVEILELHQLDRKGDSLSLSVHCSKGTYIRTLVEDIGGALNCGAHVAQLRRTGVGDYGPDDMVTLETLQALADKGFTDLDTVIRPIETAIAHWPEVNLSEQAAYFLQQGQAVTVPHAPTRGWVRLYSGRSRFLGMGEILDDGRVAPRRLLQTGS